MNNTRGFSMPIVITVLGVLAASLGVLLLAINTSSVNAASMIGRRQAFYTCDGIARGIVDLSRVYLRDTGTPTSAGLRSAVCLAAGPDDCVATTLPDLTPPGFTIEEFTTTLVGARTPGTVPSGPFTGMTASVDEFRVSLTAKKNATGDRCNIDQIVSSADISLFQFFAWADGFLDLYAAPPMEITGRTHVNGDFCASNFSSRISLDRLTASGGIFNGSNCPRYKHTTGGQLFFGDATTNGATSTKNMTSSSDTTRSDWATFAPARWGGKVSDGKTGVTNLNFPIIGTPDVQDGFRAPANANSHIADNSASIRFIIDPPQAVDNGSVSAQRYACIADIRIINGVWYKRPISPPDGCGWPGDPIWSDHPGSYTTSATAEENILNAIQNVGQEDLLDSKWGSNVANIPKLYSYYEYDAANGTIFDNTTGVISYGTLARSGTASTTVSGTSTTTWKPGFWHAATLGGTASSTATANNIRVTNGVDGFVTADNAVAAPFDDLRFCPFKSTAPATWTLTDRPAPTIIDATTATPPPCHTAIDADRNGVADGPVTPVSRAAMLLAATRSGLRDIRAVKGGFDTQDEVLPINFDVGAFATAMETTTANELGSLFSAGATFNGIVYISATWPGSGNGYGNAGGTTLATLPPRNGANDARDVNQVPSSFARTNRVVQRGLPYPLCSTSVGGAVNNGATRVPFTAGTTLTAQFSIPPCANAADLQTSRPAALRVINARSLTAAPSFKFPQGLSIVTNLPVYVLGDFNAVSITGASTEWRPAMIGGDAMTYLSNNWQDTGAPWADGATTSMAARRTATPTKYSMAGIAGDVQTGTSSCTGNCWSGGLNNFPRFMEKWSDNSGGGNPKECRIVGSFVVGFRSVYARQPWTIDGDDDLYFPPDRQWDFDTNFNTPTNQPPGAPLFSIDAIRTWRRQ